MALSFKSKVGGGLKVPNVKIGGGGSNSLQNMMLAQAMLPQKEAIKTEADLGKASQERGIQEQFLARPGTGKAMVTGVKDPSGVDIKTQAGQDYDVQQYVRQKAAEDARKLSGMMTFVQQLSDKYDKAYDTHTKLAPQGWEGKLHTFGAMGNAILFQNNPDLLEFTKLKAATGAQMAKFGGDVGNISIVEQANALGRLPEAGTNWDLMRMFTPDSYKTGRAFLDDTMNLYQNRIQEAQRVAETGDVSATNYEKNPKFQNVLSHRKMAMEAIAKGASADKVAAMFKQETGEEL